MGNQMIISIGREFGSGGHEIAAKLAKHYNLPLWDRNLLEEIAQKKGVDATPLQELDEKRKNLLASRRIKGMSSSPEENVCLMQFDYLRKLAENGESFVVVGRCSESVLSGYEGLISVFVLGRKKQKINRIMEKYHVTEERAAKLAREKDAERKRYHNSYCRGRWGYSKNYDISINSSMLGIEDSVEVLIDFIDRSRN